MPFTALDELAHDLGPLRIAEIHAVGDGERIGADSGQIAPALGHRLLGAFARIGGAIAGRHVAGDGEALARCRARAPRAASPPGRCTVSAMTMWSYCSQIQRREERWGEPIRRLERAEQAVRRRHVLGRDQRRASALASTGAHRPAPRAPSAESGMSACDGAAMAHHEPAGVGGAADHREVELPFAEHALGDRLGAGLQHHEHALLALRQHHLVGGHAGLARRHAVEVELDADAALVGHLDRRRGEARRAHVLDGDDGVLLPSARGRLRAAASR